MSDFRTLAVNADHLLIDDRDAIYLPVPAAATVSAACDHDKITKLPADLTNTAR